MSMRDRPPFRADHVGSLIRPQRLREARESWRAGRLAAEQLRAVEDECIREAVVMQERAGLRSVSDGEFRRDSWRDGFFNNIEGFSSEREEADFEFRLGGGYVQRARPVPRVIGRLERRRGIATREFEFLRSATHGTPKITLPAPSVMHFFRGSRSINQGIYPDTRAFMTDVSRIYQEELRELAALGCSYVQFDEVALPIMCDPGARELIERRGESPEEAIELYIAALNDAVRDRPAGMTVCLHMCRGNVGEGMGSGGYDPIAERVFNEVAVDGFLLEYDTPRAGDFAPLRFMPTDKIVALGLVSTKLREIEPRDALKARIEEAARHVPLERLCLCPQCGFASGFQTARMTIDEQARKLEHMVTAAEAIWG